MKPCALGLTAFVICSSASASERLVTLPQAYQLALKHHPSLELLAERVQQADAARRSAWAAIKPTLGVQGSFTHYDKAITLDFGELFAGLLPPGTPQEPFEIQRRNQFAFAAQANLPLLRGPAYARIGASRRKLAAAEKQRLRSRQDFLLQVARSYYQVLGEEETVRALENKVEVDRRNLAAARARQSVGKSPRSETLRAELVLTQDDQSLVRQRHLLQASRRELAILVGLPGTVAVQRPAEAPRPQGSAKEMLRGATRDRADLDAVELQLQAAGKAKQAAWWSFVPTLDLSWLYRWQETEGFAGERGSWNLVLTLDLPLYDGGLRYARLREASSSVRAATAEQRLLAQEIERQIVRLRAELAATEAGVISAAKAVELARTTAADISARYDVGAATQLDVLDAAQRQLEAELALTGSRYTRELARLALLHAMGRFPPDALSPRP